MLYIPWLARKQYSFSPHFAAFNITKKVTCKQMFCYFWHIMTNNIYAKVRIHFVNSFCKVTAPRFWPRYSTSDVFWIFIQSVPYFFRKIFIIFFIIFKFWNAWSWCSCYVFNVLFIFFSWNCATIFGIVACFFWSSCVLTTSATITFGVFDDSLTYFEFVTYWCLVWRSRYGLFFDLNSKDI